MNPPANADPTPPPGFLEEARLATASAQPAKLTLLAAESEPYSWRLPALELIAQELLTLNSLQAATHINRLLLAADPQNPQTLRMQADLSPEPPQPWPHTHVILFTGHMIDAPSRATARFPASVEPAARQAILSSLRNLHNAHRGSLIGLAGGASGGDLLFHECCFDLGIETLLRLTLPSPTFIEASVAPAGPAWIDRFHALLSRLGPTRIQVLGESKDLPAWMGPRDDYDVWQRTNLWLIHDATLLAPQRSLIALWDGKSGDGPGGAQHLIQAASGFGVTVASVITPPPPLTP